MWFAYASIWISTAGAAAFGIYWTGEAKCLLALLIPAFVSFERGGKGKS